MHAVEHEAARLVRKMDNSLDAEQIAAALLHELVKPAVESAPVQRHALAEGDA